MKLILFIIILFIVVKYLRLSLDETRDGKLLLWYGRKNRKYICIWEVRDDLK